ncbi:putative triacylglycerol lipase [Helianthus debilis subsp. tardiflorus]
MGCSSPFMAMAGNWWGEGVAGVCRGEMRERERLYIFGDSLVDFGNNNYLDTLAIANFPHNGIDFPTGPTGRFCNGKNVADFLAEKVGLPSPPPYLSLVSESKNLSSTNATVTGVSFASGGSGVFNGSEALDVKS